MRRFFLIFLIVLTLLSGYLYVNALDNHSAEEYLSKRVLTKREMPVVDSILNKLKETEGIYNPLYADLCAKRVKYTFRDGRDTIASLISDLVSIAPSDVAYSYADFKPVLQSLSPLFYDNKEDQRFFKGLKWNAERNHGGDSIDLNPFKLYTGDLYLAGMYEESDSVFADYQSFAAGKWGEDSPQYLQATELRCDNLKRSLYGTSEKALKESLAKKWEEQFSDLLGIEKRSGNTSSYDYQKQLSDGAFFLNLCCVNGNVTQPDSTLFRRRSLDLLKEWYTLKGDTLDIQSNNGENIYTLKSLIKDLVEVDNDMAEASRIARRLIDKTREAYGETSEKLYDAYSFYQTYIRNPDGDRDDTFLDEMIEATKKIYGTSHLYYQALVEEKRSQAISTGDYGSAISISEDLDYDNTNWDNGWGAGIIYSQYGFPEKARKLLSGAIDKEFETLRTDNDDQLAATRWAAEFTTFLLDCYKYRDVDAILAFTDEFAAKADFNKEIRARILQLGTGYAGILWKPGVKQFLKEQLEKYPDMLEAPYRTKMLIALAEICVLEKDFGEAKEIAESLAKDENGVAGKILSLQLKEYIASSQKDYRTAMEYNLESRRLGGEDYSKPDMLSALYRFAILQFFTGEYGDADRNFDIFAEARERANLDPTVPISDDPFDAISVFYQFNNIAAFTGSGWLRFRADAKFLAGKDEEALQLIRPIIGDSKKLLENSVTVEVVNGRTGELLKLADETVSLAVKWASRNPEDLDLCTQAYDILLLTKQLTLNTSDNIRKIILASGDQSLRDKYEELVSLNQQQDEAIAAGHPDPKLDERRKALEIQLAVDAKVHGDISEEIATEWRQIREHLGEGDCAVEFAVFDNPDETKSYMALYFDKDSDVRAVKLFDEDELDVAKIDYNTPDAYNLIWRPLLESLRNVRNIYFSPAGKLHLVALEYLTDGESVLDDRYGMYRLSSTRRLIDSPVEDYSSLALFGGVDYEAETGGKSGMTSENDSEAAAEYRDFVEDLNRGIKKGASYLPGTKDEVEAIGRLMDTQAKVSRFEGADATEQSLKDISGKAPDILHIATHGFYMGDHTASRNNASIFGAMKSEDLSDSDKAMIRSGLLMAGANRTLKGTSAGGGDDGILTAREVSMLDLSDMRLVVLSACNTALGEISGEGVAGLQRGFKMAGADSMMVTLWPVNDQATRLLMTEFYRSLISGFSARESMKKASGHVREFIDEAGDRPYEDPRYWGAFILIDSAGTE